MIETARWHISRFDTLRGLIAGRASFIISANAVLVGGIALLLPKALGLEEFGGELVIAVLVLAALATLGCSIASIVSATGILVSLQRWRELFGSSAPLSMLYTSSDTLRAAPTFTEFAAMLRQQTLEIEHQNATVSLWVVINTYSYRYAFLRRAVVWLRASLLIFSGSVAFAVVLLGVKLSIK